MEDLRRSSRVASALSLKMLKTFESNQMHHVRPLPTRKTIINPAARNESKRNVLKTQSRARSNYLADVTSLNLFRTRLYCVHVPRDF